MAIQTRNYLSVGISTSDIGRYIGSGVTITAESGTYVKVQYDDSTVSAETVDGAMALRGYTFNANANTLIDFPTELNEIVPQPEGGTVGNSTRPGQTVYDGASFILRRPMTFNRVITRVIAYSAPGTISMLFFQKTDGGSGGGAVPLVANVSGFNPGSSLTNVQMTLAQGDVTLRSGLFYVLYGRDSAAGAVTFRTRAVTTLDLMTANVELSTHPTSFTTAIAVPVFPAAVPTTFDPRQTPTGDANASASDLVPVIRFLKV